MAPYAGETDAKRVARYWLYEWARLVVKPVGWAVAIAGPGAGEKGCLQHLLGWPEERVLFIDTDKSCAEAAALRSPKSAVFHGDFSQAIAAVVRPSQEPIGWAHLDFLGHLNTHVQDAITAIRPHLVGAAALTFLRGREGRHTPRWDRMQQLAKPGDLDNARECGYQTALEHRLGMLDPFGRKQYSPWATMYLPYHSGKSPMATVGVAKLKRDRKRDALLRQAWNLLYRRTGSDQTTLRALALGWYSSTEASEIFNLNPRTVAAWRAVQTTQHRKRSTDPASDIRQAETDFTVHALKRIRQ